MSEHKAYTDQMEEFFSRLRADRPVARYMSSTHDLVENQIQRAYAAGKFNNLAGAGQPLNLQENPYENPEHRLVNKILSDNNFAPYWVEVGKAIDAEADQLAMIIRQFQTYLYNRQEVYADAFRQTREYKYRKRQFRCTVMTKLEKIHKLTLDYNLACPVSRLQRNNDKPEKIYTDICAALGITQSD